MIYAVVAIAVVIIVVLLLRRRDPRVATIRSLPAYATPEAASLHHAIATQGAARLMSPTGGASPWVAIEPARDEAYFRDRIGANRRSTTSPVTLWQRSRVKPVQPKPLAAPRNRPGRAPRPTVLLPAVRCRICGRALTNSESRRRGVGPDCYRNYGARVVRVPNPAFSDWTKRKELMEAQQAAWQSLLDELYRQLMQRFEAEMRNWSAA